jgi:hypothetical protein
MAWRRSCASSAEVLGRAIHASTPRALSHRLGTRSDNWKTRSAADPSGYSLEALWNGGVVGRDYGIVAQGAEEWSPDERHLVFIEARAEL